MNYLVTGCTGFIGSRLISQLLKGGHHIFCISNADGCPNRGRVIHLQHDISRKLDYDRLPSPLNGIIHVAGVMGKSVENVEMFKINTLGTLHMLEFGKKARAGRFVFISSGAVYGYSNTPFSEESPLNPVDFYGQSKYQSELLVSQYGKEFISTVILRLFFPYGPGQTKGIVPEIVNRIRNHKRITIYNDANPRINPVYITDVVQAIEKTLSLEGRQTLNLCGNEITNIRDLSLLIGSHLGSEPLFSFMRDENIADRVGENVLSRMTLGIAPLISLKEGIANILLG